MNISIERLTTLLNDIKKIKIGIYGDFCLDAYWTLDPRGSEVSLETGLQAQAVNDQRYTLGGASNVAANLAALNPKEIKIFGIAGGDIFGKEMIRQLKSIGCNTNSLIIQSKNFETYTFCKLILNGIEQPRIDFGTYNTRSSETDEIVLDALKNEIDYVDIMIINQQVPQSITNVSFIEQLNKLIETKSDKIFIVDSRHYTGKFHNVSLKANDIEATELSGGKLLDTEKTMEELKIIASSLSKKNNRPIFITLGANGILAADGNSIFRVPGLKFNSKLDIVGAGDTVISALACSLAAGAKVNEAIEIANFAAGVTVQKIFTTGTASTEEILHLYNDHKYKE